MPHIRQTKKCETHLIYGFTQFITTIMSLLSRLSYPLVFIVIRRLITGVNKFFTHIKVVIKDTRLMIFQFVKNLIEFEIITSFKVFNPY